LDIYFWLAQVFQIALIVLLIVAWRRAPKDDDGDDAERKADSGQKP
jgi:hypothetical protein